MCFAIALWNEQDAILKERLFGLTNSEGNHGEDVKEYYFYLDNVPTHSYQRWLYKYPQAAYPYDDLVRTNRARGPAGSRSTSCSTRACSTRVATSTSRSSTPRPAPRTWPSASRSPTGARTTRRSTCCPRCGSATPGRGRRTAARPRLSRVEADHPTVLAEHEALGEYTLHVEGPADLLFCENETNCERLWGSESSTPYPKDGINDHVVSGAAGTVNPDGEGTKVAAHARFVVPAGGEVVLRGRLVRTPSADDDGPRAERRQRRR